ncbi:MAG TPA: hypothetical protein VE029_15295 [Rhizobacter sp.]|nr:hypothetical protein [Rhizobacter sp.]
MKLILKQIGWLFGALLVLYGALLAISLLLVPPASVGARLDTGRAAASLFLTEPKYVFMARSQLNTEADKVLLLGASNMLFGFKQARLQALVPDVEVHNLSVSGSNITQIGQIVDLVREVQTPEARRHNTYVIGLWYGLFADDKARWYTADRNPGDTDIDIERYRYGFYERTAAGPRPLLAPQHLDVGVLLIHPYLVMERAARDLTRSLRQFMAAKPPPITDAQRDAMVLSEADKQKYLEFWRDYMGHAKSLADASLHVLEYTVDSILSEGGRVILIDLPIPRWHIQGSELAADYQQRIHPLLADMQSRSGVVVLHMANIMTDDDFTDEVHPKPRMTEQWVQYLATALGGHLEMTRARSAGAR